MANYTVTRTVTGFTVTDSRGIEGMDTLVNVERLQFADKWMALDVIGNGGWPTASTRPRSTARPTSAAWATR